MAEEITNAALKEKISQWMSWSKNEKDNAEIDGLVKSRNEKELGCRLLQRMEFGTAGLRARMGAGFNMMNDLTVIQATQVGDILLFAQTEAPKNSLHAVSMGFLMVTASHNPKEDNGYKVYWSNGAQIVSPVDKHISKCIKENLEPWLNSWDVDFTETSPLRVDPYDDIHTKYQEDVKKLCYYKEENGQSSVKFTYTAMHGVGYIFSDKSVQQFGFPPLIPVPEQILPDPDFPTVKYPNPEEGKGALVLSMKTADNAGSKVILANDPDADRLALAENDGEEWTIFTGNEIGALLGWWSWFAFRQKHPNVPAQDCYMLASTVSSKILQTMATKEGFNFEETLTGFKWMGNRSDSLLKEGKTVLFAFEEAIGYMCGSTVLDKDGVSAAAVSAEMAAYLYRNNSTLKKKITDIYKHYGHHISSNSYYICHDPETIKRMFDEIRNYNNTGKYPDSCGCYKIKHVRDLTVGFDNSQPDNKPMLPVSASSEMITFTFENGCVATIRTSGTEPKIKYYTEHKPDPSHVLDREAAQKELDDMVNCIIKYFYKPGDNNLTARSS
ncbi:glucose 1,6-bisphosphate synthase-like [Ruditapes philippinarum]|uniref:glucose 1,6-bisphosphate synthase-like n=1 Tax=Ruditapes philippinarum TaxID=129788 RepID=UPI00295C2470|nr:glucose 1,6-bisphosphate synthase-like [Ruditapes philippinarum]